jgi:hypothetical protein
MTSEKRGGGPPLVRTAAAIVLAVRQGYRVLPDGSVANPDGNPVSVGPNRQIVVFVVAAPGARRRVKHSVSAGRFGAYCHWGEEALESNYWVLFRDGNHRNLRRENLRMVTMGQLYAERTRRYAARLLQGETPPRSPITLREARLIRHAIAMGKWTAKHIARTLGRSEDAISDIAAGRTFCWPGADLNGRYDVRPTATKGLPYDGKPHKAARAYATDHGTAVYAPHAGGESGVAQA